jgi:hypothetical protein
MLIAPLAVTVPVIPGEQHTAGSLPGCLSVEVGVARSFPWLERDVGFDVAVTVA